MSTEIKSPAEWQALLAKKEEEIAALQRQVDWLSQQLRLTRGQRFGASSEQTQTLTEQLCLFNEAEALADDKVEEPELEQITYKRRKQAGKREMDLSKLPTEQVVHELRSEERVCPECGGPLHQCGQSVLRRELARLGVPVSRQTMANWIIAAHERWFSGFVEALRQELLTNEILHADETSLMVLQEPGRKASQKSFVWVYDTSRDARHPVALYDYQPSRAGVCASKFLEGFSGYLHTDGYDAYHCKLPPEITTVGCWAHMRRKFTDTLKSLPKEVWERSPAQVGLDYCDRLFHLEKGFSVQKLSFRERYRARLEQSKPLAEQFFAWAAAEYEKNPVPKSMFGAALTYAVNQKAWLMNVFLDGRLELSNNRAERTVRPFAVGRKNWLFSNTPKGADASAAVYSIVETAKANGLRPYRYLKFLLERLSAGVPVHECFPWSEAAKNLCK